MKKAVIILTVCFLSVAVNGAMDWDIYNDATIQDGDVYGTVNIYDTPPDQTTVNMTGGQISYCNVYDVANFNCYGGYLSTITGHESSTLKINGVDNLGVVFLRDTSVLFIEGGNLKYTTSGGNEYDTEITLFDSAELHIYGYNFEFYSDIDFTYLTGYLADNKEFNINFARTEQSKLNQVFLYEVPEPTTLLLFSICGILIKRNCG